MNNHSRTLAARLFTVALLLTSVDSTLAAVRYVDVNSTKATPPYISWATAATNIQDAVDAAVAGDEIVVTNGTYSVGGRSTIGQSITTNRVVVDKPLALRSVNGPQSTIIDGGGVFRCVYLTNGASLSGFTLTNGRAHSGGGVWCESTNAVVSNCVVSGNSSFGGGTFRGVGAFCCGDYRTEQTAFAGGVYGGTINNCILNGNWAANYATPGRSCDLSTCSIASVFCPSAPCGDQFPGQGGGAVEAVLNNCTLTGNGAGFGGGAYGCTLNNCTLAINRAYAYSIVFVDGGGVTIGGGGGAYDSTLNNCIVYFNSAPQGPNYDASSILNYSCTTPLPTNGVGNITNDPAFVNAAAGNYRLRPDSPCIDAGTNLSAIITNDLDGRPRPLDGNGDGLAAFDMGAYEYRTPLLVWQDSPTPTPPHVDWQTAAHTIQDAVDAAFAGDEIVVTNGIYATGGRTMDGITTNRVAVDKQLALRSLNGPQFTIIDGAGPVRCVYLANSACLSGFTLTNAVVRGNGGGVFCESQSARVTNCVVVGNVVFANNTESDDNIRGGGGAFGGTLDNCTLRDNAAGRAHGRDTSGGGAYGCVLNNCTLSGNSASEGGGAVDCTLNKCRLTGNVAFFGGGAAVSTLSNCELTGNSAISFGGGAGGDGGGAFGGTLNNCTVIGNSAEYSGGGAGGSTLNNCILFGNTHRSNCEDCGSPGSVIGNNWIGEPLFVNTNGWTNLRLQSNSPCINAGLNAFAPAGPDLDGNPRIVGYTVDMGAYESQSAPSIAPQLSITSTGTNVLLAWPTDYAGVFIQGDHYEAYFLYSTTNLVSPVVWRFVYPMPVVVNGQLIATNSIDGIQRFYRIVKETGPLGDVPCLWAGPNPCPCADHCIVPTRLSYGIWTEYATCRNCD